MDPILRRGLFFYLSTFVVFSGVLGRYLGSDRWPAIEVIPLLMPVYLLTGVLLSEKGEIYAFLRTLPIAERSIVRRKFGLILAFASAYWLFMMAIAFARLAEGVSGPSTLVYITVISGCGLVLGACTQVGIWRFGHSKTAGVVVVLLALNLTLAVVHTARLKRDPDWPVLVRLGAIDWMGGAPWTSVTLVAAVAFAAAYGLMRIGLKVKQSSEEYL
jgi:hypothetical protein